MACKRSGVRIPIAPRGHEHISKNLPMTRPAPEGHLRGTPAGGRIADLRERKVSVCLAVGAGLSRYARGHESGIIGSGGPGAGPRGKDLGTSATVTGVVRGPLTMVTGASVAREDCGTTARTSSTRWWIRSNYRTCRIEGVVSPYTYVLICMSLTVATSISSTFVF